MPALLHFVSSFSRVLFGILTMFRQCNLEFCNGYKQPRLQKTSQIAVLQYHITIVMSFGTGAFNFQGEAQTSCRGNKVSDAPKINQQKSR